MEDSHVVAARVVNADVFDDALRTRLERARSTAVAALLAERNPSAGWSGELSASALSTATAVTALTIVSLGDTAASERLRDSIRRGFNWLITHQNSDGGWGDTTRSFSNISTTALVWAALGLCRDDSARAQQCTRTAEGWLTRVVGSIDPDRLVEAIERRYGRDRTFSIPILTMCVLCGRLGSEREGWRRVRQLPFEVAALPQAWFGAMQLPVVSYALPALIAIGQVRHGRNPTGNFLLRWLRDRCCARTLQKLEQLQPTNGGFLEAAPLTSFVVMSLAALGKTSHPVVRRGVAFLEASIRADGSWPIDTNLATWLTTLAVNGLASNGDTTEMTGGVQSCVRDWLLNQQYRRVHPYTLAAPGGWAWTDLPGGVPDADDTAGAILALMRLDGTSAAAREAVQAGVRWLLELQNRDGGVPTFCRGWGRLPFDRSSPDITAHAIRAWIAALAVAPDSLRGAIQKATRGAVNFLIRTQRTDGTWIPLWFGNQEHPFDENPLYGTARVLLALLSLDESGIRPLRDTIDRALEWLVRNQASDGGWSGAADKASSMEETAVALEGLGAAWLKLRQAPARRDVLATALTRGGHRLAEGIEQRQWESPAPIGLYFAKLWYFERLYPLIFATAALTRLARC